MISEDELSEFYHTGLGLLLSPLEQYRSENTKKLKIRIYWALFCSIFLVLGILSNIPILIFILAFPVLLILGFASQHYSKISSHLRFEFKKKILPEILKYIFDDFEYIPNQKIAKLVLAESMIFPKEIADVTGEDFMQFKIQETRIMFCESEAYSYGYSVIFEGIFIAASFNKYFTSRTVILPRKQTTYLQKIKRQLSDHLHKIKLEDIEFDREFIVFSNDQVDVRYILTPSLMQRILDFKSKTRQQLAFSFVGNWLYCAIPNYKDLFEPAVFEPFDIEFIKATVSPIQLYTGLVEDLNLNLRIWSK
jgi:hypothetical protein